MWISGGDGWDVARGEGGAAAIALDVVTVFQHPGMQRAAVFNMPVAVAVAQSYDHYLALPKKYKLMILGTRIGKIFWVYA